MDRLGATQLDLLARHRAEALDVLLPASAAYDGRARLRETPAGKALLARPAELLVSVAVSAAAAAVERRRLQSEQADAHDVVRFEAADAFPADVLAALRRRHLPFSPADLELLLDLGASTMDRDRPFARSFETLSFAVTAGERLLRADVASASLVAALERAGQAIEALGVPPRSDAGDLRRRIRALIAAQVPGGLLDLVVIDPRDGWAAPAKDVLRAHAERWAEIQRFVALLARARGPRPTVTWRRELTRLTAGYGAFGDLLQGLLEPVVAADLSSSGLASPPAWLLAPDNEVLVKGAVWATAQLEEPWVVPLLGQLALRGAAPSPHPTVTTALSLPVASASIEALAALGTPASTRELGTLLAEIRRRDLLRRIASIVGEPPPETRARDERLRREKQRSIRLRADPEPRERRRLAKAAVRRTLRPVLREVGFAESSGREFWRELDDRVETVRCTAHGDELTLALGIWFPFVPRRTPVPASAGRPRLAEHACDLHGRVRVEDGELRTAGHRAVEWFERRRPLEGILRWLLVGVPSDELFGPGRRGSQGHALLTGYVARELGEQAVARRYLGVAAASLRAEVEERRQRDASAAEDGWEALAARVEADAAD